MCYTMEAASLDSETLFELGVSGSSSHVSHPAEVSLSKTLTT